MPVLNPEVPYASVGSRPPAGALRSGPSGVPFPGLSLGARLRTAVGEATAALEELAGRPVSFFLALMALNALLLPYAGFRQDARLYAFQVLNVLEEGRFGDDLFFRYGSQDRYSAFSLAAAPLLRLTGVPLGFFLLYLAGNALFLFALLRFVQALVSDRGVAAWALVFLAVTRVPFGMAESFYVGENFLTPRLLACGLVLLGMERLLAGRPLTTAALLLPAFLMHPLMALGGCLVFLGWGLVHVLPWRGVLAATGAAAALAAVVLLHEPLGARLLGRMDAEWYELIRRVNPYQMPSEWAWADWLRIALAGGSAFGAWYCAERSSCARRFLGLLLAVSALGLGGTVLACRVPYALPLQAQPYRVLWLLQMLQVPLSLLLLGRWWRAESVPGWAAGLGLAGCLALVPLSLSECLPLFVAVGLFALRHHAAPRAEGCEPEWPSLAYCLWAGVGAWVLLQVVIIVRHWHEVAGLLDPIEFPRSLSQLLSPLCRALAATALVLLAARALGCGRRFQAGALAACLLAQVVCFALPGVPAYAARFQPHSTTLRFLQEELLKHRPPQDRPPTVYWPEASLEHFWLTLGVSCYFDIAQLSGNSFARGTAVEGERRLGLVRPFEIDSYRRHAFTLNDLARHILREIFQCDFAEDPPTRADLVRLCQDPLLDFVVVRQQFDGLAAATDGAWFLYDCRAVRAAFAGHHAAAVPTAAGPMTAEGP